ncbi:hypothetical protein HY411_02535 [Candidatus Gottesmanbacteria bacterium]|nr:hypothetical protein [Candidatus Gottesmanbacteria bacterium]
MKQLASFLISVLLVTVMSRAANAAAATPSATPTETVKSDTTKKIEDLKERLATKVAQLRTSERRAIYGSVKSTSITSFVVETKTKDIKIELTDEIKVIQNLKGKRTILSTEDVAKGDTVSVFGAYDTTLDLLKASVMFIQGPESQRVSGSITARDDKEFTLTITTAQGQTYTIDIEKATKTLAWDREKKDLVKSGFSQIATGSTIHVVGSPVPKQERRISADRILDLGNVNAPAGQATQPSPTPTETEASPAASPTKKATQTPAKKPTPTPTP